MKMLKYANQILVFLLELTMLGSFAYYCYHSNEVLFTRLLLMFLLPILASILWAVFAAPKSSLRLAMPYLAFFRAFMFLLASFSLYESDHKSLAITTAILAIATQVVDYVVER